MLMEIADYLVANGHGTVGVDLFLGDLPAEPPACAAIAESGGLPPMAAFDATAWEQPRVQVLVRALDYAEARERAQAIYLQFLRLQNEMLGGTFYAGATPTPPEDVGRDAHLRPVIAVNVQIQKALSEVP